jgi:hypothetical protein
MAWILLKTRKTLRRDDLQNASPAIYGNAPHREALYLDFIIRDLRARLDVLLTARGQNRGGSQEIFPRYLRVGDPKGATLANVVYKGVQRRNLTTVYGRVELE